MSATDENQSSNLGMPANSSLPPPAVGGPLPPSVGPGQPANPAPAINPPTDDNNTPAIADDTDLIEKEWVDKAKQILAQNRDDPHTLNQAINKVKADYIKKRYNKDLKTTND